MYDFQLEGETSWEEMYKKLSGLADGALQLIWDSLKHYDPRDNYDTGISMDDWCQAVYSEMDKRGMPHKERHGLARITRPIMKNRDLPSDHSAM